MTESDPVSGEPPPILEEDELVARLESATGLLLGIDFDGTLTTVAADPADPEITTKNRRALCQLADTRNVRVAVVSGRSLSDLRDRVGIDGIVYAGNHGLELRRDTVTTVHPAAERNRSAIQDLTETLEERLADVDGCIIENKRVTTTVHYRQVPNERVDDVRDTVRSVVSEQTPDRVRVGTGKAVMELRPAISHDKGTVVRQLAHEVDPGWITLYLGDDATDEDAFGILADTDNGLGIHVGDDPATTADRRLPDPSAVERTLTWLADRATFG